MVIDMSRVIKYRTSTMGNMKLLKGGIAYISLPPGPPVCKYRCRGCYAYRSYIRKPHSQENYNYTYRITQLKDFPKLTIDRLLELKEKYNLKYMRLHDSGDFYNQDYINKWVVISKAVKDIIFFGYTKRYSDFNFKELISLRNVIVIDSLKFGVPNFGKYEEIKWMIKEGARLCPSISKSGKHTGITCNNGCTLCMQKSTMKTGIVFIRH